VFGLTTSDHGVVWMWCKDTSICKPMFSHAHAPGEGDWYYTIQARRPTPAEIQAASQEREDLELSEQSWIVVSLVADNVAIEPGMN
jgi:hypothetical protein